MKKVKNFKAMCEEIKANNMSKIGTYSKLRKIEKNRYIKKSLLVCGIADIICIAFSLIVFRETMTPIAMGNILLNILILDIFITIYVFRDYKTGSKKYLNAYKQNIINDMLGNFFNSYKYTPVLGMQKCVYDEVIREMYNRYRSSEYVIGNINGKHPFEMAKVFTANTILTHNGDENYQTVFEGIHVKIGMPKSIDCKFSMRFDGNATDRIHTVQMDNTEFEKMFDVVCDDKMFAMRLLTHDVMDRLLQIRQSSKIPLEIWMKRDRLYIRLHISRLFEDIPLEKDWFDTKILYKYYNILKLVHQISIAMINAINSIEL